ncbi:MAG: protein kinase domain-containing protein [Candidatus Fervidibacter sp.]|uniref:protein kinase domain-containing protein n=1 Tax=Candidatus Fervidibacter sp. TaxID=3100871 RepID=UPI00404AF83D
MGRYCIERLLGCRGFGAVYLARDLNLPHRQVAIKENHNAAMFNAFLKEAEILSKLHHPNMPRVSDYFQVKPPTIRQPRAYMVMDYIEGEELWERIQNQGKLSEKELLDLLIGIFDALEYLHSRQPPIFHRDIKPQNIIITPDGQAFLVDFGIAKVGRVGTPAWAQAITQVFSPPEQYQAGSGQTDERSDQYALAMRIYCALTGKLPTYAEATARVLSVMAGNPDPLEPIEKFAPNVSVRVRHAVMKALSIDKDKRFANIREFRQALYPPMVMGLTRRQLIAAVAGTTAIIGLALFGGYQFWKWSQPLWLVAELKGHKAGVTWVAFTPDGKNLLSASHDNTIRVWDWQKGKNKRVLKGHSNSVRCLALLSGNRVASASWDGTVRIWNWQTGEQVLLLQGRIGRIHALAVSRNNLWLAAGGERGIIIWSLDKLMPSASVHYGLVGIRSLAFHPNNKVLAAGDEKGQIWLLDVGGKSSSVFQQAHKGAVTALAFHPEGSLLLSGGEDASLAVWDVSAKNLKKRMEGWHQGEIRSVAFRKDGNIAVSCSMDDRLRVWQVRNWQMLFIREGGRNWALALAFDPSGEFLASASKDETVKVWRTKF